MGTGTEFFLRVALSFLWIGAVAVFCILMSAAENSLLSRLVGKPIVIPIWLDWILPFFVAILVTWAIARGVHFIQRKRNPEVND